MKASILVLSLIFSSVAFAAKDAPYVHPSNCTARTQTGAHETDDRVVTQKRVGEFFSPGSKPAPSKARGATT